MKKSKFITGLSAAFISAMALMSCSSLIKPNGDVVLTIDGIPYTAEELFEDQKTPAAAEAKFNAIYKVAVRAYFDKNPGDMAEITRNTKIKISEQKAIAQSNAEKSGTSYDEEWQKILDANDVEDEAGLYNKFEYDLQKEKFENKLYDNNYDRLREGGKLKDEDGEDVDVTVPGYIPTKMPYHMKHILVKVSAADKDNTTGTITKAEAKKLHDVITGLANGSSFDSISENLSDDDSAKKNHASLGIMSRDTSFVDDFKLGTYLYEAFFGSSTTPAQEGGDYDAKIAKNELFGTNYGTKTAGDWADKIVGKGTDAYPGVLDPTTDKAIGVIPYEAALALGEEDYTDPLDSTKIKKGLADFEYINQPLLQEAGITKDQFKEKYLPRNVIFNKYFNKHNIMVIAPTTLPQYDISKIYDPAETTPVEGAYVVKKGEGSIRTSEIDDYVGEFSDSTHGNYASLSGFTKSAKNEDELNFNYMTNHKEVLRDENGRIILAFRSGTGGSSSNEDTGYQGIHFIVIERSPFIGKEFTVDHPTEAITKDDYYTVYYPGQTGTEEKHPTYNDGTDKNTFVNFVHETELLKYKEKADTVKSELKKVDNLNTYVYDYLLKKGTIEFTEKGQKIADSVSEWIDITREDTTWQNTKNWNENWQKFYYSLKAKRDERIEYPGTSVVSNLIPEACAIALTQYADEEENIDPIRHMFGAGGVWHE